MMNHPDMPPEPEIPLEELKKYYDVAYKLVRDAGEILRSASKTITEDYTIKTSNADIVTVYDRKVENYINKSLKEKFEDTKFIGEEAVFDKKAEVVLSDDPTWILDPIDGTLNFAHAFPYFGISLAFSINARIQFGIVYNPIHGEMFTAIRGEGAFKNGRSIRTSKMKDMPKALICCEAYLTKVHKKHAYRLEKIVNACQGVRSMGSAALAICYVACGALDAYEIEYTQIWDVAAASVILEEAGGVIRNQQGGPINLIAPTCVVAGTEALADKMIAICMDSERQE